MLDQLIVHRHLRINDLSLDITLGIGLSLIYLSSLLTRRKRTAFIVTAVAYAFYLGANIEGLTDILGGGRHLHWFTILRALILPIAILLLLLINHRKFVVRSDAQSFQTAITVSVVLLSVTFVYGTLGFYTLGQTGFHQKLSVPAAMHYTIDQLNLTTNKPIHAYDARAKLFDDSLSFISIFAVVYVLLSFVQPLRARFGDQRQGREKFNQLIEEQHDSVSEDFFKLWPHDKQYYFDSTEESGLAFHVYHGSALILGGPAGKQARFKQLLSEFRYICWGNDWQPAIIHADDSLRDTYEDLGFSMQKIGEEAVVDLFTFTTSTVKDKYFRNIVNRFEKQGYTFELLTPPHHQAVLTRLKEISEDWLDRGNHAERGYAMGYFSEQYMAMGDVAVARDAAGTIQAFMNLVPAPFDKEEATYDLLRASQKALGNVNDYLLINLCGALLEAGYKRINLGFTPLVGMDSDESKGLISNVLGFAYANGDRFYSFSGLYKFKNKYAPSWKPRYVVYQGGIRGFSKIMNALMRTMTLTAKPHHNLRRHV
ncbi:MAG TPA: phosphatidylglycerol lysyltransferase domain-containing protein [Candidatus Saccharimonadales bacterium]